MSAKILSAPPCILVCRDCGDGTTPMPFGSEAERGKWASQHTRETGHHRWGVFASVYAMAASIARAEADAENYARLADILCAIGAGCLRDHEHAAESETAMSEMAARWRWDDTDVERLRALRAAVAGQAA